MKTKKEIRLIAKYNALNAKIGSMSKAREQAERAFDKVQSSKDWEAMCELVGACPDSNFGDWSC